MAVTQKLHPVYQALSDGVPISGGLLYVYATGTSTPLVITYADAGLTVKNSNPIILDSRGEAKIFGNASYRFILKDPTGTTILLTTDAVSLVPIGAMTFCDEVGSPLSSARLATYVRGTSTPKTTYYVGTSENTNPVIADTNGNVTVYGPAGDLDIKYILENKDSELIWSIDSKTIVGATWVQHFYGPGGSGYAAGWESVLYFGSFNIAQSRWDWGYTSLRITTAGHTPDWFTGYRPTKCRIAYTVNESPYANCTITNSAGGIIGTGATPNLSTSCTFDLDFSAGLDIFRFNFPGVDRVTNIEFYG